MSGVRFAVDVERSGEGVRIDLMTPDGEIEHLGEVEHPAQVMGFAVTFASMMASMISSAIYEARS